MERKTGPSVLSFLYTFVLSRTKKQTTTVPTEHPLKNVCDDRRCRMSLTKQELVDSLTRNLQVHDVIYRFMKKNSLNSTDTPFQDNYWLHKVRMSK